MTGLPTSATPRIVLVSGHMVDHPDRPVPRFPHEEVPRVTAEIRSALEDWHVGPGTTVITGGARGADIIALEQAHQLGAEAIIYLALPSDEFEQRSVALPGRDWSDRYRALFDWAEVEHLDGGSDDVFARTNTAMIELARSLASDEEIRALVVWNGMEGDGPGGTLDFIRQLGITDRKQLDRVHFIDPTARVYEKRQLATGQKRLLSLDGGGIRGVLSLEVLAKIEDQLRKIHGDDTFKLAQYFDYFGGTSTGAIIAAGLANGMEVKALQERYATLGKKVFRRSWLPFKALYRTKPLQDELEEMFDPSMTLGDPKWQSLLLLVMHNTVTDSVWPISNCTTAKYNRVTRCHPLLGDRNLEYKIVDLLRATTAAPVYFAAKEIKVGDKPFKFQDGGITPFNNPALMMVLMATLPQYRLNWSLSKDDLLVVSVGTGSAAAVHPDLKSWQVHHLFNVKNLPSVFMNGAAFGQDLLSRALGVTKAGDSLDSELGDLHGGSGLFPEGLFTYVRYDANISDDALQELGIAKARHRNRVRKLDAWKATKHLQEVGRSVNVDVATHFAGFL